MVPLEVWEMEQVAAVKACLVAATYHGKDYDEERICARIVRPFTPPTNCEARLITMSTCGFERAPRPPALFQFLTV